MMGLHLGHTIIRLDRTTSTNDVARRLGREGAADGTVVIANEQTAGRGRRGRTWSAPKGTSILLSLIIRPTLTPAQAVYLTMLAAVACVRALHRLSLPATIKWPNDVLVNGRKVAGILTETEVTGDHLDFAVIGVGVNINVTAADLAAISPLATSMMLEAGRCIDRDQVLHLLLDEMNTRYRVMREDGGQAVYQEWASLLETVGRQVTLTLEGQTLRGRAAGVSADGSLILERADGQRQVVSFGDVW